MTIEHTPQPQLEELDAEHSSGLIETRVVVTPQIAEEWLKLNTKNYRRVYPSTLKKYKEAMRAGRWEDTGDPIRFGRDGTLYDGQHRLMSQVATNTTLTHSVVWGLSERARDALDQGKSRLPVDVLGNHGVTKYTKVVASVLRLFWSYDSGLLVHAGSAYTIKPSLDEYPLLLEKYPESQRHQSWAAITTREVGLTPTALVGFRNILERVADAGTVEDFWDGVEGKVPTLDGDPRRTLMRWGRSRDAKSNNRIDNSLQAYAIFSAWNAWRKGKTLRSIRPISKAAKFDERGNQVKPAVYREIPKPV